MSYKYTVPSGNTKTEFSLYSDATNYAASLNINESAIYSSSYTTASVSNDDIYNTAIKTGYNIQSTPYYLGLDTADRVQFVGMLALLNEAIAFGYMTTASMTLIRDKSYNDIPMTVGSFKQLMLGYGMYYKSVWDNREDPPEFNT